MLKISTLLGMALILGSCTSTQSSGNKQTPESNAFFALGVSSFKSGEYPAAYDYFKKAESLVPDNPSYEMHTGLALMSLERNQEAEAKINSACQRIVEFPDCWNNLAVFYLKTNRPQLALDFAQKAANSSAYHTPEVALANEARAYIELRRLKDALTSLEKAERIGQSSCTVQLLKAKTLNRQRLYDVALDSAKRAESLCVSDARTHFWVAYLEQKNGRNDLSEKKLRNILDTFREEKTTFQARQYLDQLNKKNPLKEPQI
jgi:type IV pilus assembly protein PilF